MLSKKGVHDIELNHNPCSCTLYIHVYQAGLYPAFGDTGLHQPGNVIQAVVGGGADWMWMVCCIVDSKHHVYNLAQ